MRRGIRTVFRLCACGCGENVPPYISPTSNRVKGYTKFIPGHGNRDWGKRWAARIKSGEAVAPNSVPIGTRKKHNAGGGLFYFRIKIGEPSTWEYEHRFLMATHIGRPLTATEHVHHINGDSLDNRITNLAILSNDEHAHLHHAFPEGKWSKFGDNCAECCSRERPHGIRGVCDRCIQRKAVRIKMGLPIVKRHRTR